MSQSWGNLTLIINTIVFGILISKRENSVSNYHGIEHAVTFSFKPTDKSIFVVPVL